MSNQVPSQVANWIASLPQDYVGDLYATLEWRLFWILPIKAEFRVPVWGQVADGRAHEDAVCSLIPRHWPFSVRYISFRNVPHSPKLNDRSRTGKITNLKPFKRGKGFELIDITKTATGETWWNYTKEGLEHNKKWNPSLYEHDVLKLKSFGVKVEEVLI